MTFEIFETIIAESIEKLTRQRNDLEAALGSTDLDFESPTAIRLDAQLKKNFKQASNLEQIAFFIIQQEDELNRLREENGRQLNQIVALRQMNERLHLRAQASRAVAELHKSKWQSLETASDRWCAEIQKEIEHSITTENHV